MINPWIEKLEEELKLVNIYKNPRRRKVMWEDQVLGKTIDGGDILEFGVASGGSIGWFTTHFPSTNVYGFDSFFGLPEDWDLGNKILPKGTFSTNGIPPLDHKNITYVKGKFEDTFQEWFDNYNSYAKIVHIDCDLYSAAKLIFQYIKPTLRVGSYILFDELTHPVSNPEYLHNRQHEYKAFKEFLDDNPTFDYQVVGRTDGPQVAIKVLEL